MFLILSFSLFASSIIHSSFCFSSFLQKSRLKFIVKSNFHLFNFSIRFLISFITQVFTSLACTSSKSRNITYFTRSILFTRRVAKTCFVNNDDVDVVVSINSIFFEKVVWDIDVVFAKTTNIIKTMSVIVFIIDFCNIFCVELVTIKTIESSTSWENEKKKMRKILRENVDLSNELNEIDDLSNKLSEIDNLNDILWWIDKLSVCDLLELNREKLKNVEKVVETIVVDWFVDRNNRYRWKLIKRNFASQT